MTSTGEGATPGSAGSRSGRRVAAIWRGDVVMSRLDNSLTVRRRRVMNRREFLETVATAAVLPTLAREDANEWGTPVFDLHFHLRPQIAANLAHLDGAGISNANLLTRGRVLDQVKALQAASPGRFTWFNSYDVTQPDAE